MKVSTFGFPNANDTKDGGSRGISGVYLTYS